MAKESNEQKRSTSSPASTRGGSQDVSAPPSGFRTVSLIVSSLLLVALIAAISLAILDNPRSAFAPIAAAPTGMEVAAPGETEASSATPFQDGATATPVAEDSAGGDAAPEELPGDAIPTEALAPIDEAPEAATPTAVASETPTLSTSSASDVRLGDQRRVEAAGFAFQPVSGYSSEFSGVSVTLSADERSDAAGTLILLQAEPGALLVDDALADLDNAFAAIVESMSAQPMLQSGEPEPVTIDGEAGQAIDIIDAGGGSELSGRIVVARPEADRLFLAVALAPGPVWDEYASSDFAAVLGSVEFFPAVATPESELAEAAPPSIALDISATALPDSTTLTGTEQETATPTQTPRQPPPPTPTPVSPFGPQPNWRIASNGNFVNQVAVVDETMWTATDGGIVAWNLTSGNPVKFTTLDGLSANRAVAAENCPLPGLGMVFATDSGLQVFDRQTGSWKVLDSAGSPMSFDDVSALYCDVEEGYLIAAYARHGLDIFDANSGEWTHIDENDGLEYGIIREITVTSPQTIWIASQTGLTRYVDGESTLFNVINSPMTASAVTALASDGDETVWLATAGDLYRTDGEEWETFNRSTVTGSEFPNGSITGLAVAQDGSVWVGSDQTQVCRFDPEAGACAEFYSNEEGMAIGPLTSLRLDATGVAYYTTSGAGLSAYDGTGWSLYFIEEEPIAGNRIRSMAGIDDGTTWVATGSGVSQVRVDDISPVRFFTAADTPLLSQDVRAVEPATEDSAWFGTGGGANFYDDPNWTSYTEADGLAGADIRALAIDSQSRTWIGSGEGLSIWTGNGFFNLTTDNGLPSDSISALLSVEDLVWIGTDAGLLRFQDNQLQVFNRGNINLPSDVITALALAADGSLLIGTDQGLARFQENRIIAIPDVPSESVTSIAVGPNGDVWVSTAGENLYYFDGATWIPVVDLDVLPSQAISTLYVDANGDLWIGSSQGGLAIVTPQVDTP